MSGKRLLLDTNAIVQLLAGNDELAALVGDADFIATSIVCELEFLSFPGLSEDDAELFSRLKSRIQTFGLPSDDTLLTMKICRVRAESGLKLPDAIIAGTAICNDCAVVTADAHFSKLGDACRVLKYAPMA